MDSIPARILREGRSIIDPVMEKFGFHWSPGLTGTGSGGSFDNGQYVLGNRKLELHFRNSLGCVTYHIGEQSLSHADYIGVIAPKGQAQYPGFSNDPLDGFRHLAHDLMNFGQDFLAGSGEMFAQAVQHSQRPTPWLP